ncbi:serine hydrolase domain-containing protein [Halomonas sp. hl-4]|uniref:serine hydrolase domain-containing protein n=1 Tax=Halomonas sp. hl-4 TaxID=1761789 RepID=UPI000BB6E1A3|nr:serine hydrolase [Halomonas sp. hl-4]SNY98590.1 CubicO group peptidase, beta-lactamase class C family [Halomonas sp. hl-4]
MRSLLSAACISFLAATPFFSPVLAQEASSTAPSAAALQTLSEDARGYSRLHNIVVAHQGEVIHEHHQGGPGVDALANIKSLSKTVLAALVGAAIEANIIESTGQSLVSLLGDRVPESADPEVADITVSHLLSLQAGLERTSGENYASWVASPNWVEDALTRPFVDRPGGRMLYSTGSSHLLSAALTYTSGESTHALAQRLLAEPLNIAIPGWLRDPQGVYFGGNDMQLSPRALVEIGELYRNDGMVFDNNGDGQRVLPEGWVAQSWTPRGTSRWTGDGYGYGWFITQLGGEEAYYGRGFGGQALYVIPERELTIVITADPSPPSPGGQFQERLHDLVEDLLTDG